MVELRDYQISSINKLRQAFKQGFNRPILRLDCGAGKTITAAYMCLSAVQKGSEVLFLVHRRELLDQTIETLEMLNCNMDKVKVGMVLTVGNNLDKYNPDLIIADECNFALAKSWKKIFLHYPEAKIVGLSATPVRLSGESMGDVFDYIVEDITAEELIERGNLCDYDYFAPPLDIDFSKIGKRAGDYKSEELEEELKKVDIFGDVLKTFKKLCDGKKTIVYCCSIKHSEDTCAEFVSSGYRAEHIDGNVNKKERKKIIERFKSGETQILCNCNLVSFGFNVPDCDCVILLRPTQSLAIYIQSAMRCLRGRNGKKATILDFVGNVQRHGMPTQNRTWSLEGKKKSKKKQENEVFVKQCPQCYFTYSKVITCPSCGYKVEKTQRELEYDKEVELQHITEERKKRIIEQVNTCKDISECRTFPECVEWCKMNGKKTGYAYYYWKDKGYGVKIGR